MPYYEYRCAKCKKSFSEQLSFDEFDRKKVKCPKCGSQQVDRQVAPVQVKTSKKS
jgi:putative FmdB family regulatory protein